MSAAAGRDASSERRRASSRWLAFAAIVAIVATSLPSGAYRSALAAIFDWHRTTLASRLPTLLAARALAHDRHAALYALRGAASSFVAPPFAAVLARPLAAADDVDLLARASSVSFVLLVLLVSLAIRVARPRDATGAAAVVLATIAFHPVARAMELNESSVLVAVAIGAAMVLVERGDDRLSGASFAVACLVEPRLVLVLALLPRSMRALSIGAVATFAVGLFASLALAGPSNHVEYLRRITAIFVHGHAFSPNPSFGGLVNRLFSGTPPSGDPLAPGSTPIAVATALLLAASLLAGFLVLRRWRPRPEDRPIALGLAWLVVAMAWPVASAHEYAPAMFLVVALHRASVDGRLPRRAGLVALAIASFVLVGGRFEAGSLPMALARVATSYRVLGGIGLAIVAARVLVRPGAIEADGAAREVEVDARLRRAFALSAVGAAIVLSLYLLSHLVRFDYGRDQGIYAVVARAMLAGGRPYHDAWDFKPPGIYFPYALARAVLGPGEHSIRVLEAASLASIAYPFWWLSRRFVGDGRAGLIGAGLAVLSAVQLEFWHTAQPESFGGVVLAWALLLAIRAEDARTPRDAAWYALGAGLLYGFAGWLKPPLVGAAAYPAISVVRSRWRTARRDALLVPASLAAGVTIVTVLIFAYFATGHAVSDFVDAVFRYAPHYTALSFHPSELPSDVLRAAWEWAAAFSAYDVIGLVALFAIPRSSAEERRGIVHVGFLVLPILVGVGLQAKFFEYHYGACLPFAGLLAGWGIAKLLDRASRTRLGIAMFATLALALYDARTATRGLAQGFWTRCAMRDALLFDSSHRVEIEDALYSAYDVSARRNRLIAEWLRAFTPPDAPVLLWAFEPVILDASGRPSMTRYIYDVPLRTAWSRADARRELMEDFARRPPAVVVVSHGDVLPLVTGNHHDSAQTLAFFPALRQRLEAEYRLVARIDGFDILLRAP